MSNNVTLPPQGTSGTTNAIVESLDTTGAGGPQRQFVSLRSSVAGDTADVLGTTGDSAPSSDTAAASINGRLQRVAQNITTVNAKLISGVPVTMAPFVGYGAVNVSTASVTSSASSIANARTGVAGTGRGLIKFSNSGLQDAKIGAAGVTFSSGYPLLAGETSDWFPSSAAWFGICNSGQTTTISFVELF